MFPGMKYSGTASLLLAAAFAFWRTAPAAGQSNVDVAAQPLQSRIETVAMFKNGLALVHRVADVPGEGVFEMAEIPHAVHGTLWIDSEADITVHSTTRLVDDAAAPYGADLQSELADCDVAIRLAGSPAEVIEGRIPARPSDPGEEAFSRNYETRWNGTAGWPYGSGYHSSTWMSGSPQPALPFQVVDAAQGRMYVDADSIASINVRSAAQPPQRREPILRLIVSAPQRAAGATNPIRISISYLSRGMAWAPAYRMTMDDSATLRIDQQATIRNELEDVSGAEIFLISGFPSVAFSHVVSPMAPGNTLATFFHRLSLSPSDAASTSRQVVMRQQVMGNVVSPEEADDLSADVAVSGDGVDLHYRSIGRHSLLRRDSLMLTLDSAQSPAERVIEWIIPDQRDEFGHLYSDYDRDQNPEKFDDSPWDAIRFRNPFQHPMTTAPAAVHVAGKFGGQTTVGWTNPGEQATVRVTKALTVRTRSIEWDCGEEGLDREAPHSQTVKPESRDIIEYGGRNFRRAIVQGELSLSNPRDRSVTICIRKRFSGELLSADDSPKVTWLERGAYAINRRHEMAWTISLKPGQDRTIGYRYAILVPH